MEEGEVFILKKKVDDGDNSHFNVYEYERSKTR